MTLPQRNLPTLVYHADWGTDAKKRWIAKAVLRNGSYRVDAPVLVGNHAGLIGRIATEIGKSGIAVVGFDFPIGLPAPYAALVGLSHFRTFLLALTEERWSQFYEVCTTAREISHYRPFYPYKPGGTKQKDLLSGLGLDNFDELRRRCELGHNGRRAACPLFWTLGPNQVGKAAIIGWRDVLIPALRSQDPVLLWPFDGSLHDLLKPGNKVIVETYPAEYYGWFLEYGLRGKGKLEVRKSASGALFGWANKAHVEFDPELKGAIEDGFPDGDDAFDAAIGLFGMLDVLLNGRESGEPDQASVTKLEGWILGQHHRTLG